MSVANEPSAKITFRADDGEVETLWASDMGGGRYCLDSSPWFQYGVSWKDVVAAAPDACGQLFFSRVVEKAGHRTVRVLFDGPKTADVPVLVDLVKLGCTFEGYNRKLFAVDIPPGISLPAVMEFLVQSRVQWEHADPSYTELYGLQSEP